VFLGAVVLFFGQPSIHLTGRNEEVRETSEATGKKVVLRKQAYVNQLPIAELLKEHAPSPVTDACQCHSPVTDVVIPNVTL